MHLETIKLAGFKSFIDVTLVPIAERINVIVGPNGCGKSNIVDAIRWVIGESSAKQLRGQLLQDVISNGAEGRAPTGYASVELVFDNSDGRIGGEYAGFGKISVQRKMSRDGSSQYSLNGTPCRRRDIIDVFLGTGLGPRSYAIIEQGTIAQLILAKPDELRVSIEEAAGTTKYKERRRETELRMRHTQDNLDRLSDLYEELLKQQRSLKRQANTAEKYKAYQLEQRQLKGQCFALQWRDLTEQLNEKNVLFGQQTLNIEEITTQNCHIDVQIERENTAKETAHETYYDIEQRYFEIDKAVVKIEQQLSNAKVQLATSTRELEEAKNDECTLRKEIDDQQMQAEQLSSDVVTQAPLVEAAAQAYQSELSTVNQLEAEGIAIAKRWETAQLQCSEQRRRIDVQETRLTHYRQQQAELEAKKITIQASQSKTIMQIGELSTALKPLATECEAKQILLSDLKKTFASVTTSIEDQRTQNQEHQQTAHSANTRLQALKTEHATLLAKQKVALEGDDETVNQWITSKNWKQQPRLGEVLHVIDPQWVLAVETVLTEFIDAVCLSNFDEANVSDLVDLTSGRVTLLENGERTHDNSTIERQGAQPTIECRVLSEYVECEWPLKQWLQSIYVQETLAGALDYRDQLAAHESVVTKSGIWIGRHWVRVAKPGQTGSVIERKIALAALKEHIEQQEDVYQSAVAALALGEKKLITLEQERDRLHQDHQQVSELCHASQEAYTEQRNKLSNLQQDHQRLESELKIAHDTLEKVNQEISALTTGLLQTKQQIAVSQQTYEATLAQKAQCQSTLQNARVEAQKKQQVLEQRNIRLAMLRHELTVCQQNLNKMQQRQEKLVQRIADLNHRIESATKPQMALETELQSQLTRRQTLSEALQQSRGMVEQHQQALKDWTSQRNEKQAELFKLQQAHQTTELDCQALKIKRQHHEEQVQNLEMQLDNLLATLPEQANRADWEAKIVTLTERINRLGPINLAAIDEYREVETRIQYLDSQRQDLNEALNILQEAIRKIDQQTKMTLQKTFDQINQHFQSIFPKVFGGGHACLELLSDDILTSGVIVRAKPPGKRNTTIQMLSGGEKALTAIALLFAMFQLNPAPFCVLDEVDAPLDEVNVERYTHLIKHMAGKTQFIIVTHNKVTMEMADQLLGVTMQEAGVSRLVSVDMADVASLAV